MFVSLFLQHAIGSAYRLPHFHIGSFQLRISPPSWKWRWVLLESRLRWASKEVTFITQSYKINVSKVFNLVLCSPFQPSSIFNAVYSFFSTIFNSCLSFSKNTSIVLYCPSSKILFYALRKARWRWNDLKRDPLSWNEVQRLYLIIPTKLNRISRRYFSRVILGVTIDDF